MQFLYFLLNNRQGPSGTKVYLKNGTLIIENIWKWNNILLYINIPIFNEYQSMAFHTNDGATIFNTKTILPRLFLTQKII